MNPYEVLGVDKDADKKTIRSSYKKLVAIHHPDKGGDTQKFQEIQEAHDLLMDPARRARFDKTGRTDENKITPQAIANYIEGLMQSVVIAQAPNGFTDSPVFENIKDKVILMVITGRASANASLVQVKNKLERCNQLLSRFITKEEFDPVGDALRKEKRRLEDLILQTQDAIELSIEGEKVLKAYQYKVGPEPEGQFRTGPTNRPMTGLLYHTTSTIVGGGCLD